MLEVAGLTAGYGRIEGLHDVSLRVPRGARRLSGTKWCRHVDLDAQCVGMTAIRDGQILFDGKDLRGHQPEDIIAAGIIHVPQGRKLFPDMTIADNLRLGTANRRIDLCGIAADQPGRRHHVDFGTECGQGAGGVADRLRHRKRAYRA